MQCLNSVAADGKSQTGLKGLIMTNLEKLIPYCPCEDCTRVQKEPKCYVNCAYYKNWLSNNVLKQPNELLESVVIDND